MATARSGFKQGRVIIAVPNRSVRRYDPDIVIFINSDANCGGNGQYDGCKHQVLIADPTSGENCDPNGLILEYLLPQVIGAMPIGR